MDRRQLSPSSHKPTLFRGMWPPHYHLGCSSTLSLALSCGGLFSSSGGSKSLQGNRRKKRKGAWLPMSLLSKVLNEELDNREGIFNSRSF